MTSPSSGHTLPDSADQGNLAFILHGPICFIPVPGLQICSSLGLAGLMVHLPPPACAALPELSAVLV